MPDANRRPAAILWDFGNTLVDWSPRRLYENLIDGDAALEHFLGGVCTMDWHSEHDRGVSFAENRAALTARHPEHADLIAAWDERWAEMFDGWVEGMAGLVETLHSQGVPQHGLSNMPAEKWPGVRAMYPALDLLDVVVISAEENLIKPDPAIYARTIDRLPQPPSEVLFVDDRADNVDAAERAGFMGHHFTGAATLFDDLRARGLTV